MTRQKAYVSVVFSILTAANLLFFTAVITHDVLLSPPGIALWSLGGILWWDMRRGRPAAGEIRHWREWALFWLVLATLWSIPAFTGALPVVNPDSSRPDFAPSFWPRAFAAVWMFCGINAVGKLAGESGFLRNRRLCERFRPIIRFLKPVPFLLLGLATLSDLCREDGRFTLIPLASVLFFMLVSLIECFRGIFHKPRRKHLFRAGALFLLGLFLAFFAIPQFGRAREPAKHIACRNNLRQLQFMLEQYLADEHSLPPDLKTLHDGGYLSEPGTCVCPTRSGPAVSPDAFRTDYLYTVENDIVTLADKPDNHPHGFVNKISFPLSSP